MSDDRVASGAQSLRIDCEMLLCRVVGKAKVGTRRAFVFFCFKLMVSICHLEVVTFFPLTYFGQLYPIGLSMLGGHWLFYRMSPKLTFCL